MSKNLAGAKPRSKSTNPYTDVPSFPFDKPEQIAGLIDGLAPLEIEIGFGRGRFLLDRAVVQSEARLLGIETRRKWVHVVAERAARRQIGNVTVLHGDARAALTQVEQGGCVQRFFVNFPDPWWKARHAKRLVIERATIEQIARLLVPGGELMVQTDVDFRAEAYKIEIDSVAGLSPANGDGFIKQNPFGARSLREIRCEEVGLPIYRLLYTKD